MNRGPRSFLIVSDSSEKKYGLEAHEIKPVATGHGGCIASDMITVEGRKVGFMYRDEPAFDEDSGWRFVAGLESAEYMDDPDNHAVYDVNTIANYDAEIIPFLNAPIGSAYERDEETGEFLEVDDFAPEEE